MSEAIISVVSDQCPKCSRWCPLTIDHTGPTRVDTKGRTKERVVGYCLTHKQFEVK